LRTFKTDVEINNELHPRIIDGSNKILMNNLLIYY